MIEVPNLLLNLCEPDCYWCTKGLYPDVHACPCHYYLCYPMKNGGWRHFTFSGEDNHSGKACVESYLAANGTMPIPGRSK